MLASHPVTLFLILSVCRLIGSFLGALHYSYCLFSCKPFKLFLNMCQAFHVDFWGFGPEDLYSIRVNTFLVESLSQHLFHILYTYYSHPETGCLFSFQLFLSMVDLSNAPLHTSHAPPICSNRCPPPFFCAW